MNISKMNDNLISIKLLMVSNTCIIRRKLRNKLFFIITCVFGFINWLPIEAQIIDIGNRRQLFVDDMFILEENNIKLQVHKR